MDRHTESHTHTERDTCTLTHTHTLIIRHIHTERDTHRDTRDTYTPRERHKH